MIACNTIGDTLRLPDFKQRTSVPIQENKVDVPNEDLHTTFLQMDFALCLDENGDLFPQLIEVQGFPTLYFFQQLLADSYREIYELPDQLTSHFNAITQKEYVEMLRRTIVGDTAPEQVVMLEIEPEKQHTYIDFLATGSQLGIMPLCLTKLKKTGRKLYYHNEKGMEVPVRKIYNRVIFDELFQRQELTRDFYFNDPVDVEWIGHPNWFYRISKYILPLLEGPFVPESYYLDQLHRYPDDLHNFVLKPLFSFAGAGVELRVTPERLDALTNKNNYILQRKVEYAPVLSTPSGPAKCELRILMLWEKDAERPIALNNMMRITKGEMVGVKYNRNKDWVGASIGFFA